jgi:hypothetical protein
MNSFRRLLAWAQKNERHLGAALFVFGFAGDLATFALLDASVVSLIFVAYLGLAIAATLGSHALYSRARLPDWKPEHLVARAGRVLLPLAAQYALGSLLSGFLIFYTKSAALSVSWPFLAVLALVFLGNEYFRTYKDRLTFQAVLLFITIYAYAIFAVPLLVHRIGPWTFIGSTAASLAGFALVLFALLRLGPARFLASAKPILISVGVTVALVVGSYLTGILPPLPLALREAGVYHRIERTEEGYLLTGEAKRPWYGFMTTPVVHATAGETLYGFSSVFAPYRFSAGVVHHWERYDTGAKRWITGATIAFPISGGRQGGYRGYTALSSLTPGLWRLSIETPEGRVIGREKFRVERVGEPVPLHEEVR